MVLMIDRDKAGNITYLDDYLYYGNSETSYDNEFYFYASESSVLQETKNNIQTMISDGYISNVYYGCDDANSSSCNKR